MPQTVDSWGPFRSRFSADPDADAIYESAMLIACAPGDQPDLVSAVRMLQGAARRGHAEAQMHLGTCYASGLGVERDQTQAARWFQAAAESGLPRAQYWLARCYFTGIGVPQDFGQAYRWSLKARAQGFGDPGEIARACALHLEPALRTVIEAAVPSADHPVVEEPQALSVNV